MRKSWERTEKGWKRMWKNEKEWERMRNKWERIAKDLKKKDLGNNQDRALKKLRKNWGIVEKGH